MKIISSRNLEAIARTKDEFGFARFIDDLKAARENALERVLTCGAGELIDARAELKVLTAIIDEVENSGKMARERDAQNNLANPGGSGSLL